MPKTAIVPTLARRFLLSKSSDGFLSFIAWVSVVGVALRVISGTNGEVIFYTRGEPIDDPAKVEEKIREAVPQVEAITPTFTTQLMASGPNGVAGAVLEGVDLPTLGKVTLIPERVSLGRMPEKKGEIIMGYALADRIGATVGSEIRLIIPFTEESETGMSTPKTVKGEVVGIAHMGLYEYDSQFIYAPIADVQEIVNQPGKVTTFKLKLKPGADSRQASDRLADQFGYPFRAKDWMQMNKNVFYAIRLEKTVIAIILAAIVIVASFNVVSTLMMMIHDKSREIAILKAMGLMPGQGFRLFCLIGIGMGSVGTVFGVALGLGVSWILATTKLIQLPADIYYISFLPVVVRWHEIGMIAAAAMLISFVATLFPAYKVSKRTPLEGLRYE
jgi:lipoprotein-releasing system permease protein